MFLFSRFKEIFSKDFWKKGKFFTLGSSVGFFVFWGVILSVVGSLLMVLSFGRMTSELSDDFRRDFVDFEVKLEDGVLSTRNVPDPFVLSEFLKEDGEAGLLDGQEYDFFEDSEFNQEFLQGIREGMREGFEGEIKVDGRSMDAEDLEFVVDTEGVLGLTEESIPRDKVGFYFFGEQYIVTNPMAEVEGEGFVVESYEEAEDFTFDKEFILDGWQGIEPMAMLFVGIGSFVILLGMIVFVRFITNFWWAFVIWGLGQMFGFKFDYFEAYGVGLNYLVPITFIEIVVGFFLGWIPFLTLGLMLVFGIAHGVGAGKDIDKPEVLEEQK